MPSNQEQPPKFIFTGWVLKKKKKKMQGYAKRWLMLSDDGLLSYSVAPEKEPRGSIEVPHASVSSDQRHGTIHVDSGSNVFHFKMLSDEDFQEWRGYLRRFLHVYTTVPEAPTGTKSELIDVLTAADKSESILSKSLDKLKSSTSGDPELINSLEQVQNHIRYIRSGTLHLGHHNLHAAPREDNRDSNNYSITGAIGAGAGAIGAGAGAVASWALGRTREGDAHSTHDPHEEGTFYDANDLGGTEYLIDEDGGVNGGDLARDDASNEDGDDDDSVNEPEPAGTQDVVHRTKLPSTVAGEDVSLFSVLKKNVGKDLSAISFPVTFNCPLSLLQAATEEFEYAPDLLETANASKDWVERFTYVGAFAVSGYASTAGRTSRKPFNPLLGETYECVRADRRLRFVAEKVEHRPPVVASYADGNGWKAYGWNTVKNKFWGKSFELIPEGEQIVELADGDKYSISRPSSFMRNLIAGNKYLEHVGELNIVNLNTNRKMVIQFKESSMFGGPSSRNFIEGSVEDENGGNKATVKGKWDDKVMRELSKDQLKVLWEAAQLPPRAEQYYGFTYFAISLNEITDDIKNIIPPTDSRLRPDQRALENGDTDTAEEVKHTLEEAQRSRRKDLEASGQEYVPQWFHHGHGDEPKWMFGGPAGEDYFATRDQVKTNGQTAWNAKNKDIFTPASN